MRATFHLVPEQVWTGLDPTVSYEAASLAREGFIHCTDGVTALGVTFDRYYALDGRPFVALTVDLELLDVPWRYDVAVSPYPHIYGPITRAAVVGLSRVERGADGRFAGLTPILAGPAASAARSAARPADDRERQRDAAALLGTDVAVTAPPVDRVFGDRVDS
jgi:uncharacterized protein (DUF952 family)